MTNLFYVKRRAVVLGCGFLGATVRDPLKPNAMSANLGLGEALYDPKVAAVE